MALGASRGSVFRMIYRQSIVIIAAGLGIGLAVAILVARAVGSLVVVSVWDPDLCAGGGGPCLSGARLLLLSCAACDRGGTNGRAARGLIHYVGQFPPVNWRMKVTYLWHNRSGF
jgi:ABC-type antimicrobial peptide transport system permease subunit